MKFYKVSTRPFLQVTSSAFGSHRPQIIPFHQKGIKTFYLPACNNSLVLIAPSILVCGFNFYQSMQGIYARPLFPSSLVTVLDPPRMQTYLFLETKTTFGP